MAEKNVSVSTLITLNKKHDESYRSVLAEYLAEKNGRNVIFQAAAKAKNLLVGRST